MRKLLFCALISAPVAAQAGNVKASSELKDGDGVTHNADLAFDGLLSTAWAEAEPGPGDGAWLELKLDKPTELHSVSVWPYNLDNGAQSAREYGRAKTLTVTVTTKDQPVVVQVKVPDVVKDGPQRIDVPLPAATTGLAVRVTIDEGVAGYLYDGTYIAEVALDFTAADQPPAVQKVAEWAASDAAKTVREKNKDTVVGWFETVANAELGDMETTRKIMAQAIDGAPFVRDHAKSVPQGWRIQAIPPDDVAIEALLKLKNPNAIPAILDASLRTTGKRQRELTGRVEYFQAYAELLGGGRKVIAPWGETGWEPGALQSYGEPLALIIDQLGAVYVADPGNSRVQRFDEHGNVVASWGGEAAITDQWFKNGRKYYVSGGTPGDGPGKFDNAIDITRVPGKHADGFAVLDSLGRVQVFDSSGAPTISWKVRTDDALEPGVGGSAFLEMCGSRLTVVWESTVFVYSLTGEELGKFDLTDGTPNNATALPGGKLGVMFADQLIGYNLDGFRYGSLLTGAERGEGFEDWDATLDLDGKLWVLTDTGLAIKYKKPGHVDYVVTVSKDPYDLPRFTVKDDALWITDHDHVVKIDALAIHTKDLVAAEDAKKAGK